MVIMKDRLEALLAASTCPADGSDREAESDLRHFGDRGSQRVCKSGRDSLPLAVIGHEGSTVLVALNALRLLTPNPWGRPSGQSE